MVGLADRVMRGVDPGSGYSRLTLSQHLGGLRPGLQAALLQSCLLQQDLLHGGPQPAGVLPGGGGAKVAQTPVGLRPQGLGAHVLDEGVDAGEMTGVRPGG